ncbi:hypothetical protein VTN77DRAFT_5652 [Rasamsonia byssochlamydoides]|uniref:uncharacterized protein n=1 Tax=Rasamsonia byssochlamydoides TaxID=89139 RepID=UPI0037437D4E
MESWRDRGFVPDSDEEDELDSQESKREVNKSASYENLTDNRQDVEQGNGEGNPHTEGDDPPLPQSMELASDDELNELVQQKAGDDQQLLPSSSATKRPQQTSRLSSELNDDGATPSKRSQPPNKRLSDRNVESSSEDELQLVHEPLRKPTSPALQRQEDVPHDLMSNDDSLSSLSPPPSSIESLRSITDEKVEKGDAKDNAQAPENRRLEDLVPPLEIPEEIMRELNQPTRRPLRQRNPIQLHPYLLEDARYQSLLRASGLKPVRIPNLHHGSARHKDDSQEKEFVDVPEPPSSSPPAEFQWPPSSPPSDPYASPRTKSQRRTPRSAPRKMAAISNNDGYAQKRRKLFHASEKQDRLQRSSSSMQVVIENASLPENSQRGSRFDIPPSPPHSGSLFSADTTHADGFRFPRGFTPPALTTPVTDSKSKNQDTDDLSLQEWSEVDPPQDNAERVSDIDQDPADQEETEDVELEVQRLRRKIKGVLPASWLRLDLKQQEERERLKASQRRREAHSTMEPVKGVARKITKPKSSSVASPNHRRTLNFTLDLSDSEDSHSDEDDSHEALAGLVGFENPFNDVVDDDIPEDNRIDYMFPSTSRSKTTYGNRKQHTKQRNIDRGRVNVHEHQSVRRRPHLKRQTRITDTMSRQRTKSRSTPKPPKLGILDAPDVAQRPRKDQPQFLRVAARQARSRRDKGRKSPDRKFFKLSTRDDTEDTNRLLRDWRRGAMQQVKIPESKPKQLHRMPLGDTAANEQAVFEHRPDAGTSSADPRSKWIDDLDSDSENDLRPEHSIVSTEVKRLKSATDPNKPNLPKRYGDKWIIPRAFAVSSLKRNAPRPAEFEQVGSHNVRTPLSFRKALAALNRTYQRSHLPTKFKPSLTLDRFLSDDIPATAPVHPVPEVAKAVTSDSGGSCLQPSRNVTRRRLKKRPPKRINVDNAEHQQPLSITFEDSRASSPVPTDDIQVAAPVLKGLGGFKGSFTVDFNVSPLRMGTFFHDSTFIGSGDFRRSLEIQKRNFDQDAGYSYIQLEGQSFRWSAWNDTVSSELGLVFDAITKETESLDPAGQEATLETFNDRVGNLYGSVVKYVTDRLCFTDPVDRTAFVDRSIYLVSKLNHHITTLAPIAQGNWRRCLKIASFNLVFANQIQQVASHNLVGTQKWEKSLSVVRDVSQQLLALVFNQPGLAEIRRFLEENRLQERREAGIRDDFTSVEAYVISYHVLHGMDAYKGWFEELSSSVLLSGDLSSVRDVQGLEDVWQAIFTTLPLDEIDRFGIGQPGSRFQRPHGNWSIVKQLVLKVLAHYDSDSATQPASLNNYCRTIFHRCFHLMTAWGWRDCKIILDTLFDFFAKNTLHNLKNEECFGSPSFLDRLDSNPSLEVQIGDSCFHILLKIIGSGLRFLANIYDNKKIRNFAWRLLPNHGRVYPKDRPLHQEDLDALRNHHDLLCTLYWAVPDGCRPRIETIRNLVDPASSHQETCSLSIRSWTRLVRFKLSTNEDISGLEPFSDWHGNFVSELARQHSLARTEVESQAHGNIQFSRQLVESTISQNQRKIESLLNSALGGLKGAIEATRSLEQARVLVSGMPITRLLGLFNPQLARVNNTVKETLEVVMAYIRKDEDSPTSAAIAAVNDDSQEYGDWTGIEAMCEDVQESSQPSAAILHVENVFQPAVSRLISNCFGEDHCPEDEILFAAIDCWSSIAQILVRHRLQHWESYLSPYGSHSWMALRATVQTKKFTPQFLASCIEKDSQFYSECRAQVLNMWMSCLVERASMLKFQHRLTEALLNKDSESALLRNLPFYRDRRDDRYHITLSEFSERRLSLISSLLSNMREHLQEVEDSGGRGLSSIREEYRELVMTLMASMKANYQELGHSGGSAQGAYVDFVHRVVEFLQQHTQNICPIDRFFTEPTSFPLPASDPTYIVARLKSYGVRLSSGKVAKQLVMFLQSVSERAAVDGQQGYLVEQLCACMAETYESGNPNKPTLRSFLMRCVFPAYVECAFSNAAAWILTRPILQTISQTFANLLFDMDATDASCTSSLTNIFSVIFESVHRALHLLVDHPGFLEEPPVLVTVALFLEMITSALPTIDYLNRNSVLPAELLAVLQAFRQFTVFAISTLFEPSMAVDPDVDNDAFETFREQGRDSENPPFFEEARTFASRELQTWLRSSWSRHEGRYFIRRGQQAKEIDIGAIRGIESLDTAKATFVDAAETFLERLRYLDIFDENDVEPKSSTALYDLDQLGDSMAELML